MDLVSLVSIDPGKNHMWCAAWSGGELVQARGIELSDATGFVRSWEWGWVSEIAVEVPQVYQGRVAGTDQNDLIDLAIRAGWAQVMAQDKVTEYWPSQWKGQLPKKVCNRRTLAVLSPSELAVVENCGVAKSKKHNILDAVGIGLKHLGRR